ncbi:SLAP domain-containing protein [Clostridium algidicarnis]|uniref:SLAP domain-containing protein n=1 Tax=Clostridium algidicarnis TaxID=37659 RepID=UPI00049831F5|nr:SLAP domain-containing protein [Clostridium algidicarnis]
METDKEKGGIKLVKELHRSDFHNTLLNSEYINLVKENDFIDEHLHINLVYVSKREEDLEVGAYITNNSNKDVQLKNMPICLYKDKSKVFETIYSINKSIPAEKAVFIEIGIPLILSLEDKACDNLHISFGDGRTIAKYPYVNIDINELPKINGYKSHREMKKFLKLLPTIKKDQLTIDVFKVGQVEEGFCIIALFRNSSSKAINIKSIPLTVLVSENLPVYKGVYNINDDGLIIESNKGKFYSIIIPLESFIQIDYEDMSKYIVKFE